MPYFDCSDLAPVKDDSLDEVFDTAHGLPRGRGLHGVSAGVELFNVVIVLTLVTTESFIPGRSYTRNTQRPST